MNTIGIRSLLALAVVLIASVALGAPVARTAASPAPKVVASGSNWKSLPGSTLGFASMFQGEKFSGRFKAFTPVLHFDPARLAGARFEVTIDLASVDTQNSERDDSLRSADFFNVRKQAQARYVASRFRALGQGRFIADGVLTLNGASKAVPLAFTWTGGARPSLTGSATVHRLDFLVGSGEWADTDLLPNDVQVTTRLLLAAK